MRVPIGWLAEHVDLPGGISVEDLDDAFVRLGLEVEAVHRPEQVTLDRGGLVDGRLHLHAQVGQRLVQLRGGQRRGQLHVVAEPRQ